MKKVKILTSIFMILLMVGCTNKEFKNAYNNMQVSDKNINGYSLDLRINGKYNNKSIREIVKITNYQNNEYEIRYINNEESDKDIIERIKPIRDNREKIIYIKDNKTYTNNKDGIYVETTEEVKYKNPSIYLEGLKKIVKSSKAKEETIGSKKYKVYDVEFKKELVNTLIQNSSLEGLTTDKNINGKVYLNEENQVYRIIYNIGEIEINANYYGINTARTSNIPIN